MAEEDSPLSITASIAGILTFVYALLAGLLGYLYLFRSSSPTNIQRFYEAFAACALESDLVRQDILSTRSDAAPLFPVGTEFAGLQSHPPLNPPTQRGPGTWPQANGTTKTTSAVNGNGIGANAALAAATMNAVSHFLPTASESKSMSYYPPQASAIPGPGPSTMKNNVFMDPDSLGRLFEHVRAVEIDLQNQAAKVVTAQPLAENGGFLEKILGRGRWARRVRELEASLNKREALTGRLLVIQMSLFSA